MLGIDMFDFSKKSVYLEFCHKLIERLVINISYRPKGDIFIIHCDMKDFSLY